jgi:hypothetical protein
MRTWTGYYENGNEYPSSIEDREHISLLRRALLHDVCCLVNGLLGYSVG